MSVNENSARSFVGYPGVEAELDVPIPMRDGTILYADIYRPSKEGVYPVLVIRTPYGKATGQSEVSFAHPAWYCSKGYIVLVQDTRGRWSSEGQFYPFLNEGEDGFDTVEFAAKMSGSTGAVGTFGFSYAGINQLLTAVLRPPSLKAIAPAFTSSSPYESWSYHQGAPAAAFLTFWASLLGLGAATRNGDVSSAGRLAAAMASGSSTWAVPLGADPVLTPELVPYYHDWLQHSTYDEYWKRWTLDEDFSRINVPALHTLGQWDLFAKGSLRSFKGLRQGSEAADGQKLLVVPLPHLPWSPLDAGVDVGANDIDDRHLAFFEENLRGRVPSLALSPVSAYVIGDGWRDLPEWPSEATEIFYLRSEGRANSAWGDGRLLSVPGDETSCDVFIYDPSQPTISAGGHSTGIEGVQPLGPRDQSVAEKSKMVLVYTSQPFAEASTMIGSVAVFLFAATTAVDTDFAARLALVDDCGVSINVLEGIVRASHRDGSEITALPGTEIHEYRIDLGPVARVIPQGSRLRVDISSSDFPQWGRHTNLDPHGSVTRVATQWVYHGKGFPSRVELPITRNPGTPKLKTDTLVSSTPS